MFVVYIKSAAVIKHLRSLEKRAIERLTEYEYIVLKSLRVLES